MKMGARGRGLGAGVPAILVVALAGCAHRAPLPVLGQVPEFQLVAQTGQAFDSRSLDGHVWVADFIYTSCPGPCPMMSSLMHQVQARTAETPDVRLVSITVDPATDTPAVLGLNGFKLNRVDGSLEHSTRFALVDGTRRIRGYYISSETGFLDRLLRDIRRLEREKS